ncbi:fasciclin domain-containing protein [bacterium]|nr:fasciclin domain-containing protein [bacterium]
MIKLGSMIAAAAFFGAAGCASTAQSPAAQPPAPAAPAAAASTPAATADIVDTAVAAGQFKTLVAAVQAAGLVETLKGAGPFTVFAPTDAAFAALPAGTVETLLKPENKGQLAAILTYHVLPGKVPASAVAGKTLEPATVQGKTVKVVGSGGGVMVNDAKVVSADIMTSNGVIHVIDKVILPPM